jgi:hypothetical protein
MTIRGGFGTRASAALAAACLASCAATLGSCARVRTAEPPLPIVVVATPGASAAPAVFRGAEDFLTSYFPQAVGAKDGKKPAPKPLGKALHLSLPEAADGDAESAIARSIVEAAGDPRVEAIVVDPAPRGTASGFRRAKDARASPVRPGVERQGDGRLDEAAFAARKAELLCVAVDPVESPLVIESAADLVVCLDRENRAYMAAWAAKKLGASAIVAAYDALDASSAAASRERAIQSAAAADLGLRYAAMVAPKGVEAAAFVRAGSGAWLRDYGPAAALYVSNPDLAAPLLAGAIAGGGILLDAAGESTRASCAEALGLDLGPVEGDAKKEIKLLEDATDKLGGKVRLCFWDSGYAETASAGLGEFAMRVALGKARGDELGDIVAALDSRAHGGAWIASYDLDPDTGVKSGNRVLLRQDYYALGYGYLQSALQATPLKYLILGSGAD